MKKQRMWVIAFLGGFFLLLVIDQASHLRNAVVRNLGNLALIHALDPNELSGRDQVANWSIRLFSSLQGDSQDEKLNTRLGLAYWAAGDIQGLEERWAATGRLPDLVQRYFLNPAKSCERAGEKQCAFEQYQLAVRLDPSNFSAHLALARFYRQQRDLTDALSHALVAVKLRPDEPAGYLSLGLTYKALREFELARLQFCRILDRIPSQPEAVDMLTHLPLPYNEPCP